MPALRRCQATFCEVVPRLDAKEPGVALRFRPIRSRLGVDLVEDFAPLGPEHCMPTVAGLGKILRLLRAARIAAPEKPTDLIGDVERTTKLLEKALGTLVRLELRPRSRLLFTAWTENGVETVDAVSEVHELPDAFLIFRRGGRFPVRFERDALLRHQTDSERWFEIIEIERL